MEDKIEVNEYVRFNNGEIGKVIDIKENPSRIVYSEYGEIGLISDIVEHGKQLIDLIEKDDYVNGSKVLAVMENMETGELHLEMTSNYTNEEIGDCTIYDKDIKIILTKENYMANCYKV